MKITTQSTEAFTPVSLTLTFESQRELDGFGSLMNTACVCDAVSDRFGILIYNIAMDLKAKGADISGATRISDSLSSNFRLR